MGRYYNGDIEGKFWFGVQSSDAADRFGVLGETPNYIIYHYTMNEFDKEELENLIEYINNTYQKDFTLETDPDLLNGIETDSDIADAQLGLKIYQYLIENNECEFSAEF